MKNSISRTKLLDFEFLLHIMVRRDNIAVRDGKRIKRKSRIVDTSAKKSKRKIYLEEIVFPSRPRKHIEENPLESDFNLEDLNKAIAHERKSGRTEKEALQTALDNLERDSDYVEHKTILGFGGVGSDDFQAPEFLNPPSVQEGDITQDELDLLRGTETGTETPNYEPTISGTYHLKKEEKAEKFSIYSYKS
ncbi:hypothetical protein LCGC14_1032300 [marine sediment metagenome]|uniref:Uncharacterized protein n=1 Tax=marine sediment metagenome TaxID=412755 RepID=A0A0F9MYR6_9ZZZZ